MQKINRAGDYSAQKRSEDKLDTQENFTIESEINHKTRNNDDSKSMNQINNKRAYDQFTIQVSQVNDETKETGTTKCPDEKTQTHTPPKTPNIMKKYSKLKTKTPDL